MDLWSKNQRSWGHQKDSALKKRCGRALASASRLSRSRWLVGSSSSKKLQRAGNRLASTRRAFSPPKGFPRSCQNNSGQAGKGQARSSILLLLWYARVRKPANFRHNGGRSVRCFHLVLGVVTHAQLGSRCDISPQRSRRPARICEQGWIFPEPLWPHKRNPVAAVYRKGEWRPHLLCHREK